MNFIYSIAPLLFLNEIYTAIISIYTPMLISGFMSSTVVTIRKPGTLNLNFIEKLIMELHTRSCLMPKDSDA